mmetsp:Transcript_63723/g.190091  ORF Transcript_63723/g.190091 Transcript_63723/m.190091 type:complete len:234 (-) Transcript_63723:131-832(-)
MAMGAGRPGHPSAPRGLATAVRSSTVTPSTPAARRAARRLTSRPATLRVRAPRKPGAPRPHGPLCASVSGLCWRRGWPPSLSPPPPQKPLAWSGAISAVCAAPAGAPHVLALSAGPTSWMILSHRLASIALRALAALLRDHTCMWRAFNPRAPTRASCLQTAAHSALAPAQGRCARMQALMEPRPVCVPGEHENTPQNVSCLLRSATRTNCPSSQREVRQLGALSGPATCPLL